MRHGYLLGLVCLLFATMPVRAQNAKPFARFEIKGDHRWITKMAFSPDSKSLVATHCSKFGPTFVTLWDTVKAKRIFEAEGPEGVFNWNPVIFSPSGKWLAVGGFYELLLLHADGKRADRVTLKDIHVESLAFAPNSNLLATGSWLTNRDQKPDGDNIILWNVTTKADKTRLIKKSNVRLDRERVVGLAFSADAKTLTAVAQDLDVNTGWKVCVWDLSTMKAIRTFKGKRNDPFWSVELSSDGSVLAVVKEKELELWDTVSAKLLRTIKSRGDEWTMDFTDTGSAVLMVNFQIKEDKVVGAETELINVRSGEVTGTRKLTSGSDDKFFAPNLAVSPAGDLVAFQVDINELSLWHSKALVGVPLRSKQD